MFPNYQIFFNDFEDPKKFIERWSIVYEYKNDIKYNFNIKSALDDKLFFLELFLWKNKTGNKISEKKMKTVDSFYEKINILRQLRTQFNWKVFENEFLPEKNSTIWKIFLLHLIDPNSFPIYDKHVYRFYNFYKTGNISEIPSAPSLQYKSYKNDYLPWFNKIKNENNLDHRTMDEAFFAFGKTIGYLKNAPIQAILK